MVWRMLMVIETVRGNSVQLLTNTRGQPWTKCGFKASWQKALRGPLAPIREAGLAITGQSMQMVEHYAKQVSQKKLAASAILKWENAR
jgi:hypothetical protein